MNCCYCSHGGSFGDYMGCNQERSSFLIFFGGRKVVIVWVEG